jgi:hypothetical protein
MFEEQHCTVSTCGKQELANGAKYTLAEYTTGLFAAQTVHVKGEGMINTCCGW